MWSELPHSLVLLSIPSVHWLGLLDQATTAWLSDSDQCTGKSGPRLHLLYMDRAERNDQYKMNGPLQPREAVEEYLPAISLAAAYVSQKLYVIPRKFQTHFWPRDRSLKDRIRVIWTIRSLWAKISKEDMCRSTFHLPAMSWSYPIETTDLGDKDVPRDHQVEHHGGKSSLGLGGELDVHCLR